MKIVIAGGTGFIGSFINMRFKEIGCDVVLISRQPNHISWQQNEMRQAFEDADLVLNLSGKSINCRYNTKNKNAILASRIETTRQIGEAINKCKNPPKLWINASATGIYKASMERAMDENERKLGTTFLSQVVAQWEKTFFDFGLVNTRQIALRTSVVLGKNGGALSPLILLSKVGLGGVQATGNQMFSWIHANDYFNVLMFLMKTIELKGVINCTSPTPISNKILMSTLRKTLGVPIGIPAPAFIIKIGAKIIGTQPELILDSAYIMPKRLLDSGFHFEFPEIRSALYDLAK